MQHVGSLVPSTSAATSTARSSDRRADRTRRALVQAGKRLLPDRAPSTISGRELAAEAGVNYGLVHHYFGGKDAVLEAALVALRDDFLELHGDAPALGLLGESDPYFRALVRSQVDYPDSVGVGGEFPIGTAMVEAVSARLRLTTGGGDACIDDVAIDVEAKARVVALVSMQLAIGVFGPALFDAAGVSHRELDQVRARLADLYDEVSRRTAPTR